MIFAALILFFIFGVAAAMVPGTAGFLLLGAWIAVLAGGVLLAPKRR